MSLEEGSCDTGQAIGFCKFRKACGDLRGSGSALKQSILLLGTVHPKPETLNPCGKELLGFRILAAAAIVECFA